MRTWLTATKLDTGKEIDLGMYDMEPVEALLEYLMRRQGNDIPLSYPNPYKIKGIEIMRDGELASYRDDKRGVAYIAIAEV